MRILVLNGASSALGAGFALLRRSDGVDELVAQVRLTGRDGASRLPAELAAALDTAGWAAASLSLIVAVVGPGSFTGLRASLALAHGLALGSGADLRGVTTGEALLPALQAAADPLGAAAWCVSQARRDRIFVERPDRPVEAVMIDALAPPDGPVLLGGDAEAAVAARLAALGATVHRSALPAPDPLAIVAAALAGGAGGHRRPVQPLYVDPPEAKPSVART